MHHVSVLLSCFNGAQFLLESLTSVSQQTYENLEVIIVDDGSTDDSVAIIEECVRSDSRFRLVRKSHSGLTSSLNEGLKHCTGTWIARLDADDVCEPIRIERQMSLIQKHPDTCLVGSDYWEIDATDTVLAQQRYPTRPSALRRNLLLGLRFFPHSSAFFRRTTVEQLGGYRSYFPKAQDWDLWLRMSEIGEVRSIPQPLVRVRTHPGQISLQKENLSQLLLSRAASICAYLRAWNMSDPSAASVNEWKHFLDWVEGETELHSLETIRGAHSLLPRALEKFLGKLRDLPLNRRLATKWRKHGQHFG